MERDNNNKYKNKRDNNNKNDLSKISKAMCYLLRHQASQHGLNIESTGFVNLDDLLKAQPMRKFNVTKDTVLEIVKSDEKGRYEIINRPPVYIRAVQGHSIQQVKDEDILDPITNIFLYPVVVHGTYYEAWDKIKLTGLNKMTRNGIHFSIGYKQEDHVISGMRMNCQVYIEINAIQIFYNEIKLFISKNKVVLSPGIEGVIPAKYIKKVVDMNKKVLYSQVYEIGVLLFFEYITNNTNSEEEVKGTYYIINLMSKSLIYSDKFYKLKSLNEISKQIIDKKLIVQPFIILISKQQEDLYVKLIQTRKDEITHIAFYSDFIPVTNSHFNVESIISNFDLVLNAEMMKRIDLDYKKHFDKITEEVDQNQIQTQNQIQNQNQNKEPDLKTTNQVSDFKLTKKILSDKNINKNYLLLFLNFEEEEILDSIDYILIPNGNSAFFKSFQFKLQVKTIKENLNCFLQEMKDNLIKENVLDKMLLLCTTREDLNYLTLKMKKNIIQKPKFFGANVILLKANDFDTIDEGDFKQAAELFLIQYVLDETTIEKIKILF